MRIRSSLAGLAIVVATATIYQTTVARCSALIAGHALPAFFSASGSSSDPPACPVQFDDSLETNGIASDFRHGVTAPRATKHPEAELSDEARRVAHDEIATHHVKLWQAVSVVSLIVEQDGIPSALCVKQSAGYGLDAQAVKAVAQYRFEPATANGKPVRARLSVSVSFKVY
jgi:TonB family protein